MISSIVKAEQDRLAAQGYEAIVTPIEVHIDRNLFVQPLGNDILVLTGIRPSSAALMSDDVSVSISSSSDIVEGTMQQIASMGQAIYKTMRTYLVIRTSQPEWDGNPMETPRYTLDFVKISPRKRE
ncbi:MAG: hypothetical protein II375_08375 [Bacteroidales bacterium]|nr:hypothetical protein [Bacteroidales bacterium]MDY4175404.1 hypothetical protein [Bacteroidales bacterium]